MLDFLNSNEFDFLRNDKIVYFDIGARGGLQEPWSTLEKLGVLTAVCFETDPEELELLQNMYPHRVYVNTGVFSESKTVPFFQCTNPATSSLFDPNIEEISKYNDEHWVKRQVEKISNITCETLDKVIEEYKIYPDFLKIDTQGAELDILLGGRNSLSNPRSAPLGILVETWTKEVYSKAPTFEKIISLLRQMNFEVFDCDVAASWSKDEKLKETIKSSRRQIIGFDFLLFSMESLEERNIKKAILKYIFGFQVEALLLLKSLETETASSVYQVLVNVENSKKSEPRKPRLINRFFRKFLGVEVVRVQKIDRYEKTNYLHG